MELILDFLSWVCIVIGGIFLLIGGIGIHRMPDVYTRMHAASISETMGAGLLLAGMMIQAGLTLVTIKLGLILLFLMLTGPVATHALAGSAMTSGLRPKLAEDRTNGAFTGPMSRLAAGGEGSPNPDIIGENHR